MQVRAVHRLADVVVPPQASAGGGLDVGAGWVRPLQQLRRGLPLAVEEPALRRGQGQAGAGVEGGEVIGAHHAVHVDLDHQLAQHLQVGDVPVVQQEVDRVGGHPGEGEEGLGRGQVLAQAADLPHPPLLLGIGAPGRVKGELAVIPEEVHAVQAALAPCGLIGGHAAHHLEQGVPPGDGQIDRRVQHRRPKVGVCQGAVCHVPGQPHGIGDGGRGLAGIEIRVPAGLGLHPAGDDAEKGCQRQQGGHHDQGAGQKKEADQNGPSARLFTPLLRHVHRPSPAAQPDLAPPLYQIPGRIFKAESHPERNIRGRGPPMGRGPSGMKKLSEFIPEQEQKNLNPCALFHVMITISIREVALPEKKEELI